jgi:hypothetical protein
MLTSRMQQQPRIIVEQRRGGGCFGFLGLLLVAGLAIHYWYIALPLAAALGGAWVWSMWGTRKPAGPGSYECPRCRGDITRGTVKCTLCGWTAP